MEHSAQTDQMPALRADTLDIVEATPARSRRSVLRAERDQLASQIAIAVIVLGFLLMGFSWFGASGKNFIQQQFPYLLSGSIPGLALVILGGGVLVVRDVRRERDALEAQVARLAEVVESALTATAAPGGRSAQAVRADALVVLGRTTFHRPTCRLVRDKDGLATGSRNEAAEQGLTPCRTCAP